MIVKIRMVAILGAVLTCWQLSALDSEGIFSIIGDLNQFSGKILKHRTTIEPKLEDLFEGLSLKSSSSDDVLSKFFSDKPKGASFIYNPMMQQSSGSSGECESLRKKVTELEDKVKQLQRDLTNAINDLQAEVDRNSGIIGTFRSLYQRFFGETMTDKLNKMRKLLDR